MISINGQSGDLVIKEGFCNNKEQTLTENEMREYMERVCWKYKFNS